MDRDLILINTSHYNASNSTYVYQFPEPAEFKKGSKISLMSFSTYNSTVNIAPRFGNTALVINWLGSSYTFQIPVGYYSASDFSNFISFCLLSQGLYLNDSTGKMVSLITMEENATAYGIQINVSPIPTSSQATSLGYTRPSNSPWNFPGTAQTPQINFVTAELGRLFGFHKALVQPPSVQSTAYTKISPDTPTISPISSYLVTCNAVNSRRSLLPTLLGQVSLNASYGSLVQNNASTESHVNMRTGTYTSLVFHILSQDLVHLTSDLRKDPELSMVILIETPAE